MDIFLIVLIQIIKYAWNVIMLAYDVLDLQLFVLSVQFTHIYLKINVFRSAQFVFYLIIITFCFIDAYFNYSLSTCDYCYNTM